MDDEEEIYLPIQKNCTTILKYVKMFLFMHVVTIKYWA